ncbi:hypothetical protein J4G37_52230, partial [Microvirga sp. 3-52]|nr:hypothetical protein [Microvirga sp. 3-52]
GNTVGAAFFGAILNATLMTAFKKNQSSLDVDDVNLLLTEEGRKAISVPDINLLENALGQSLQWVYVGVAVFAVISLLLILRIPRGKELLNVDD